MEKKIDLLVNTSMGLSIKWQLRCLRYGTVVPTKPESNKNNHDKYIEDMVLFIEQN